MSQQPMPSGYPAFSVIVPVLNEAQALPALLAHLSQLAGAKCEVIVVDGGSTDRSRDIARAAGCAVIASARGRARQMNAGAEHARGEALVFLHADTLLPSDAFARMAAALARGALWGRFDVRIVGRARMLVIVAALMNWRSRFTGICTGDQALFVSRGAFDRAGGYPDQPLMEDIEISRRLKRLGPPACLFAKVLTSGRRWEQRGVWRTIFLMWRLRWDYWRGVAPSELAHRYRRCPAD